jgi:WD40 repeat protein
LLFVAKNVTVNVTGLTEIRKVAFDRKNQMGLAANINTPFYLINETVKWTLVGHVFSTTTVAFDSNGLFASGASDKSIRLWNTTTGALISNLTGHTQNLVSLAFSKQNLLASGAKDSTIRLWNATSCIKTLNGHSGWVQSVAFSR